MNIRAADNGFCIPHGHQHQHQRVVGHAVGRIGDIFNGNADALRVFHIDMVISNAPRGDIRYVGLAKRKKGGVCDLSFMTDADASVSECQLNVGFGYRCLCDGWHYANGKYSEIGWLPAGRSASTSTNADALTGLPNTYRQCEALSPGTKRPRPARIHKS